jgi:predicted 3-demethylubiquinone-9 3-methyltransferase (glyoxalase superfamily)
MQIDRQKITPCLWFDFNAEAAVNHYLSIFKQGRILDVSHYGEAMPGLKGKVLTIRFELEGQRFLALNGGPQFSFTEAISLIVDCETQAEVDELWEKLTEGGNPSQCGFASTLSRSATADRATIASLDTGANSCHKPKSKPFPTACIHSRRI